MGEIVRVKGGEYRKKEDEEDEEDEPHHQK